MDIKILLLIGAVAMGYVSHMVCRFPAQAPEVGACMAVYGILMAIHYWIENYKATGFFMCSSHELKSFQKYQNMSFDSEVKIAKDNLSANYELKI